MRKIKINSNKPTRKSVPHKQGDSGERNKGQNYHNRNHNKHKNKNNTFEMEEEKHNQRRNQGSEKMHMRERNHPHSGKLKNKQPADFSAANPKATQPNKYTGSGPKLKPEQDGS